LKDRDVKKAGNVTNVQRKRILAHTNIGAANLKASQAKRPLSSHLLQYSIDRRWFCRFRDSTRTDPGYIQEQITMPIDEDNKVLTGWQKSVSLCRNHDVASLVSFA